MNPTRCLMALLAILGSSVAQSATGGSVTDFVPREHFVIQSHRGAGVLAEENTVTAFELGWKLGTIPEADIRTTKDGVIVAFHDADFRRVLPGASKEFQARGIESCRMQELAGLDVGAWKGAGFQGRRIPRISEVFEVMRGHPDRRLYLDVKKVDLAQLAALVRNCDVAAQVILASRQPDLLREWKALLPASQTLLWMRGSEAALGEQLAQLRSRDFDGITQLQVHIHPKDKDLPMGSEPFAVSLSFLKELGAELRARGILFQALPLMSDVSAYARLMDVGVASFATDYPEVTLREVEAYYAAKRRENKR